MARPISAAAATSPSTSLRSSPNTVSSSPSSLLSASASITGSPPVAPSASGELPVAIDGFDGGDEAGRVEDRRAVVAVEERGDDGRAVIEPGPGGQTGNDGRNDPTCGRGHLGSIAAKVFGQPVEAVMLVEQTENRLVEGRHVSVPTFHV